MIVIITGPCGIGKTSVAWALVKRFERAVVLEGDSIGAVHPFEIYDDVRIEYLYQTLRHLIAFHVARGGYHNFVIDYVFETPASLARLRELLGSVDDDIFVFRLLADDAAIEQRIRQREADPGWYLDRYQELVAIQAQAALEGDMGTPVQTTGLDVEQVAGVIWGLLHDEIIVAPYDPAWPQRFEVERARVAQALGDLALEIHHVGSTAAPGLAAKPIIDILVVVRHLDDAPACAPALARLGYRFIDHPDNVDRRYFRKGHPRTHHLHIVAQGTAAHRDTLAFRDALRADPDLRDAYARLKVALGEQYRHDRSAYTAHKTDFVRKVLAITRETRLDS
ncbi:MAG: GrpB family protein [Anaerolineae bacterium]|nr:GrpB family protein [Anaerolineae bacterium]